MNAAVSKLSVSFPLTLESFFQRIEFEGHSDGPTASPLTIT